MKFPRGKLASLWALTAVKSSDMISLAVAMLSSVGLVTSVLLKMVSSAASRRQVRGSRCTVLLLPNARALTIEPLLTWLESLFFNKFRKNTDESLVFRVCSNTV